MLNSWIRNTANVFEKWAEHDNVLKWQDDVHFTGHQLDSMILILSVQYLGIVIELKQ